MNLEVVPIVDYAKFTAIGVFLSLAPVVILCYLLNWAL